MTIDKDNIDKAIEAGARKFKELNAYPETLHIKIMAKLDEKKAVKFNWLSLVPKAGVALACLFIAVFVGVKIVESQKLSLGNEIPVAAVLSIESQAGLINAETDNAFQDSINSVILNIEQEGS